MGMIVVRSPKGREVRISEKLFRSVYRSQGYRLLSDPVVVPADQAPVVIGGDAPIVLDDFDDGRLAGPVEDVAAQSSGAEVKQVEGDEPIFAVRLDGSGDLTPLPPNLAELSRAELNAYAASVGVSNPALVSNKATLLNLIGAHLREARED